MDNNENEFQNGSSEMGNGYTQDPFASVGNSNAQSDPFGQVDNGGYTQAGTGNGYTQMPNNYSMNGQPMGNPYGQPPQEQGSQGMAIAGMVLGILSLVCCCAWYIALPMAVISLILSIISIVQKKPGKGMAIAGIILSAISIVLIAVILVIVGSISEADVQRLMEELQNSSTY